MIIQCNTLVCIEMYIVYLMMVVSTYLEVLAHRLARIGYHGTAAVEMKTCDANDRDMLVAAIQCHKYIHRYRLLPPNMIHVSFDSICIKFVFSDSDVR